jgi:cytochrome P450
MNNPAPTMRLPDHTVAYALARSLFSRHRLPPGTLSPPLDELENADRNLLLQRFDALGPVFKGRAWGRFWVHVLGIPRCRRLLQAHAADLRPVTLDLTPVVAKGFMRQMDGEDHRKYRQALVRAIRPEDLEAAGAALGAISSDALSRHAAGAEPQRTSSQRFRATLSTISSGMLIRLLTGAEPGSGAYDRLMAGFQQLGPHGLVWNLRKRQLAAFAAIRCELRRQLEAGIDGSVRPHDGGVAGRLSRDGALDDTLLGNLIYMIEMGRYDMQGLFRWLTWYAAHDAEALDRMAAEAARHGGADRPFAQAFVLETLRMDQSERLVRQATRDFVFDGHLIPRHASVRLCMWEAHKLPESFIDPFRFDPTRFIAERPGVDRFSPFGLDRHQCPFAGMSIRLGVEFLGALSHRYRLRPIGAGPAVRGTYHWEPAREFVVDLCPR